MMIIMMSYNDEYSESMNEMIYLWIQSIGLSTEYKKKDETEGKKAHEAMIINQEKKGKSYRFSNSIKVNMKME